ncbi:MAG: glycosyltransferase family 2 protein [Proteobacteria bacterium]|nr:glycosyltransferase family 2 protein [Pseudomonadota bacterium]
MNTPKSPVVDVVVVARNQAPSVAITLSAVPRKQVRSVIVVDNGSTDSTAAVARDAGAVVLREAKVGRGRACLRAIAHLETLPMPPDVVVLMAGDGSDDPRDLPSLVEPIRRDNAELVIGIRHNVRSRLPYARMVKRLLSTVYRVRLDDVGPYRAIRFPALVALALTDRGGGLDVEMLVKAIKLGLHVAEVPVRSPARTGRSRLRALNGKALTRSLDATGRALFHIVRHSTTR